MDSLMPDACCCPAPVSQAPREAPARRAPPSALYLEEKSDQQKKEEVGMGEAGQGGHGVLATPAGCPLALWSHPDGARSQGHPPLNWPACWLKLTTAAPRPRGWGSQGGAERGPVRPVPVQPDAWDPAWDPGAGLSF